VPYTMAASNRAPSPSSHVPKPPPTWNPQYAGAASIDSPQPT
jgi:hypothetical protein